MSNISRLMLSLSLLLAAQAAAESPLLCTQFHQWLKARDFASAFKSFDAQMSKAVPEDKLAEVWTLSAAPLGAWVSYAVETARTRDGYQVCEGKVAFARGALATSLAIKDGKVGGFFVKPAPVPEPLPADVREEAVKVGTAPYLLDGSLVLPTGKGPFPAAILVHGSGPSDRDETLGPNHIFRDVALALAKKGIATLRYEKRTFKYPEAATSVDSEVIDDALSALKVLRKNSGVDSKRTFVIGHSLGALLTPEIGGRDGQVAGVVCLSPPGRSIYEIILQQFEYLSVPAEKIAETRKAFDQIRAGKLGAKLFMGAPASYWQELASKDGPSQVKKLARPVLVMHGDRDYQVVAQDIEVWKTRLFGVRGVEFVEVPKANHLFIVGEGKSMPDEYQKPGHFDSAALDKLAAFILATAALPQSAP